MHLQKSKLLKFIAPLLTSLLTFFHNQKLFSFLVSLHELLLRHKKWCFYSDQELHHHQHVLKMNKVLTHKRTQRKDKWHRWEFTHSRQIDDFEENLYFIIFLLPFAPVCYKSISRRWADEQRAFSQTMTLYTTNCFTMCLSHTQRDDKEGRRKTSGAYFWCFDKVKCHWKTKKKRNSAQSIFCRVFSSLHLTWVMRTLLFFPFMKNLCFYCFHLFKKKAEIYIARSCEPYDIFCNFLLHLASVVNVGKKENGGKSKAHTPLSGYESQA